MKFDIENGSGDNEQQNRAFIIGGALWALSFVVGGVALRWYLALNGLLVLVAALLQTIGAMVVAAIDADLDMFAKKHPRSVFAFVLAWIVLYTSLNALTFPIRAIDHVFWLKALPFAYLVLRYTPVLQMRDSSYLRFSDLLAYSLALDLGSLGAYWFLYSIIYDGPEGKITWPDYLLGTIYVLGGTLVFGTHSRVATTKSPGPTTSFRVIAHAGVATTVVGPGDVPCRDTHSRCVAVSTTLYTYLLTYGFCNLADRSVYQHAYGLSTPFIGFAFPIIHITLPLAYLVTYLLFSPLSESTQVLPSPLPSVQRNAAVISLHRGIPICLVALFLVVCLILTSVGTGHFTVSYTGVANHKRGQWEPAEHMAAISAAAEEAATSGNMAAFNAMPMPAQMSELVTTMFADPEEDENQKILRSDHHSTSVKPLDEKFACVNDFTFTTCKDSSSCGLVPGGIKCGCLPTWSLGPSMKRTFGNMPRALAGRSLIMIGDNTMKSMVDMLDLAVRGHAPGGWKKKLSGPSRCHIWTETKFVLCYVSAARNGKKR
jgi:hypothetical protein